MEVLNKSREQKIVIGSYFPRGDHNTTFSINVIITGPYGIALNSSRIQDGSPSSSSTVGQDFATPENHRSRGKHCI